MPAFHSASISTRMLQELGGATVVGPLLVGLDKPVQIVPLGATDADLVRMAALASFGLGRLSFAMLRAGTFHGAGRYLSTRGPSRVADRSSAMSGTSDKIKGMANEAAGNVKQGVGKLTGDAKLQAEGLAQEAKGEAQQADGRRQEHGQGRGQQDLSDLHASRKAAGGPPSGGRFFCLRCGSRF